MTRAARSVYVFGIYLIVLGAILMGSPNVLLSVFGIASTSEPWIRVLGVVVMAIGMLDVACARAEQTGFFRATVGTRLFALVAFAVFMINRAKQSREYYDNELKTAKAEYKAEIKILADKMDKYMEQDRKDMQRVIEANTRVMERLEDFLDRNNR